MTDTFDPEAALPAPSRATAAARAPGACAGRGAAGPATRRGCAPRCSAC